MTQDERYRSPLARASPAPGGDDALAELLRSLPPDTPTVPPAQQVATDSSGAVTVKVDARGQIETVEISQQWRRVLDPDRFPAVLLETYQAAAERAADAYLGARLAAQQAGAEPYVFEYEPVGGQPEPLRPLGPSADRAARWRRVREMRAQFEARMERLARIEAEAKEVRSHTGPHGYLTSTVKGRAILTITGDARKIQHASNAHLQEDAVAVLSAPTRPPDG